ncbi:MAG: amino acid permease [Microthrixaceae bacterium]
MATTDAVDADRARLHELGYAQELRRGLGTFSNFAISFSIISVLAGAITTFWLGMYAGGPLVITVGWVIVGAFALAVGASMGEICSSYPTAGGLYFWSAKLAKRNNARWAWWTGWFNLIGQIGVIASVDFALANFVLLSIDVFAEGAIEINRWSVFITYLIVLSVHGLLNTFGVNLVKVLGDISVWWHVVGVVVIVVALFAFSEPGGLGMGSLFEFRNETGWDFPGVGIYVFLVGLLLAQYTITGFDASAHVSEETRGAATSAPKAIVRSIYISAIAALVLNVAMVQAIPEEQYADIAAKGILAGPQVFLVAVTGFLGKFLVIISTVGQFFCGMASVTANSRMIYAFSRDGGLPGSSIWARINPRTRTPTNSLWLGVGLSAAIGALSLIQTDLAYPIAFFALTGICVVGLYISYVIPVFLRVRSDTFQKGPWHLGRWSSTVAWISVAWVALIAVVFCLPVFYPWKTWETFNFTGPILILSALFVGLWWSLSAKNHFTGPRSQGSVDDLIARETELAAEEGAMVEHHHLTLHDDDRPDGT